MAMDKLFAGMMILKRSMRQMLIHRVDLIIMDMLTLVTVGLRLHQLLMLIVFVWIYRI